jgi:hypothetical protein
MLPPNPSVSFFDNALADNLGKRMHSEAEAMAVVCGFRSAALTSNFPSVSEQLSAIFPCSPESTQRRLELKAKQFLPGRQNFFIRSSKIFRKACDFNALEALFFYRNFDEKRQNRCDALFRRKPRQERNEKEPLFSRRIPGFRSRFSVFFRARRRADIPRRGAN